MRKDGTGDPRADRRLELARGYAADGDPTAAIDLARQALELAPGFAAGWTLLGDWLAEAGDRDGARAVFERALGLDPADVAGAGLRRDRLDGRTPAGAPPAHVARLFDDYAGRFDAHLVGALGYRAPEEIIAALDAVAPGRRFAHALDLGCGTGLMGAAVRARVERLEGVDLSAAMVAAARAKGLYDALDVGEMVDWLGPRGGADMALAADVLVYVGDLDPLAAALARALVPGGLFAFTVQRHDGEGVRLGADLRFAHAPAHLDQLALTHGFAVEAARDVSTRRDAGRDVPGRLAIWRRIG